MKRERLIGFVKAIIIAQTAGVIGSIFTYNTIGTWYSQLVRPGFTPPGWLFGPVWVVLYTMMGVASYIIWEKDTSDSRDAIGVYAVQLVLNTFWSILFFGLRNPLYALIEIIVLWVAISYTIYKFYELDEVAAYLMVPYIIWVTFAAVLNYSVYVLN